MPDYEKAAERAARKYGVDPAIFKAMIRQESGFKPVATSSAGAQGIAQFMPATARAYGVNLHDNRVTDDLEGAARYIADNLRKTGGNYQKALSIYNSGRPDAYKDPSFAGGQTYNYVRTIMAGAGRYRGSGGGGGGSRGTGGGVRPEPSQTRAPGFRTESITVSPAVDNAQARREALAGFLLNSGSQPTTPSLPGLDDLTGLPNLTGGGGGTDILGLALQMRALKDQPAVTGTVQVPTGGGGSTGSARAAGVSSGTAGGGGTGAVRALSWVRSKVGDPGSREVAPNEGQLASYLNKRFGFRGAPWCAMFTSAAVTKGGAPLSARTASVAEVRAKAQRGDGYQRGLIDGSQARPGDLILFGNRHIGMVESVEGGRITYVGGNQSNTVDRASTNARGATVVRPKYGVRR